MFLKKKSVLGIVLAGVITVGGTTAFAAGGPSLTEVKNVNLAGITLQEGTLTAVEGVTPKITGEFTTKTAPGGATEIPALTVAADSPSIDEIIANATEGTCTVIKEGVIPQNFDGKTAKTEAKK